MRKLTKCLAGCLSMILLLAPQGIAFATTNVETSVKVNGAEPVEIVSDTKSERYALAYRSGINPVGSDPIYTDEYGDWTYFVWSDKVRIQGYTGNATDISIPSRIDEKNVTEIATSAFEGCSNLCSIEIPESVTKIGSFAFSGCSNLSSIEIPESVTVIGNYAFKGCSNLSSIEIPEGVTTISMAMFLGCSSLESIELPDSIEDIENDAFMGCASLTSITIPKKVKSIVTGIFRSCDSLQEIIVDTANTTFDSRDNCNAIINTLNNTIIAGCKTTTIPDTVTGIADYAFLGCNGLTSITIPNKITSIGSGIFMNCNNLTEIIVADGNAIFNSRDNCNAIINTETNELVTGCKTTIIPDTVTSIGHHAFNDCDSLTNITIPSSITSIGDYAFYGCDGLTSITIPSSVTNIPNYAFGSCSSLTSVTISNGIENIDEYAFCNCTSLTNITIPSSVDNIHNYAFYGCSNATEIVVDSENPKYDSRDNCNAIINTETNELVTGCKTTSIPNTVTRIGDYAFRGQDGLTSITIPSSIISIGKFAFGYCTNLTNITIPSSVTSIGDYAFADSNNLILDCSENSYAKTYAAKYDIITEINLDNKSYVYDGEAKTPVVTIKTGDDIYEENNYTVEYENNVNVGDATVIIETTNGGIFTKTFSISPNNITEVMLDSEEYRYDGEAKTPSVTVKADEETLKEGTDYEVTYSDNIEVGTAKVIVKGKGNYEGTLEKTFLIKPAIIDVTDITLDQAMVILKKDETVTLIAKVVPDNATDKTVLWSTSDLNVATVDANGKVTAVADGTAIVTAKAGVKTTTCTITVKTPASEIPAPETPEIIEVENVELDSSTVNIGIGKTVVLKATITPSNATDQTLRWSSSDEKVATVDKNGNIKGLKDGTATITVQVANGKSATCKVTVVKATLNGTSFPLQIRKSVTLKVTSTLKGDKVSSWKSSDTRIAKVSTSGKVTATSKTGTVTITVTMKSGATATCKVKVQKRKVVTKSLKLNKKSATLRRGKKLTLVVTRNPVSATEKITWKSSNKKIATVNKKGVVSAKKTGKVKITAKTTNGKKATCTITVK